MRHLLLCALLLPLLAEAQIYRWTDAQGRVHFSEKPDGAGAEQVEVKPQVVERDAATREREARTERFYDARRQEQERANSQAAQAQAERAVECRELSSQLQQLQKGGRYFSQDAQGNRTYISDSELEQARSRLSSRLVGRCN